MYQYWGTPGNPTKNYYYGYDALNRLLYGVLNTSGTVNNTEQNISYDVMGNITALARELGATAFDNLAYTYTSGGNPTNQLQSVLDNSGNNAGLVAGTTNYTYDGNGNMLTQINTTNTAQNKTLTYNLLNLPQTVTLPASTLTYTYDATGQKLRRKSTGGNNTTDYIMGIQYDGATTPALSFIQTEEGKAVPNGTSYDYVYYLGDNLGNTRITFGTKTGTAVSYQSDDYYPFGMEINNSVLSPKNEYLYNKKELQEELQEYDYGARFYDPLTVHWNMIDPLAEKSRRFSPYTYVEDNPIRLIDPDGMEAECPNCITDPGQIKEFYDQQVANDKKKNSSNSGSSVKKTLEETKKAYVSAANEYKKAYKTLLNDLKQGAKALGYDSSKPSYGVTYTNVNSKIVSTVPGSSSFGNVKVTNTNNTVAGTEGNFSTTNVTTDGKKITVDRSINLGPIGVDFSKEGISIISNGEGYSTSIGLKGSEFSSSITSPGKELHQTVSTEISMRPNKNTAVLTVGAIAGETPAIGITEGFISTLGRYAIK